MSSDEKAIEQSSNYIWKIPSISHTQCESCITWYIRNHSPKYIPHEIMFLCMHFFTDMNIMDKIKNSPAQACFKSDIFCVEHFKFLLEIWPNGYDTNEIGILDLCLTLASLSNKISKLEFNFTISIKETNTKCTSNASLDSTDRYIYLTDHGINVLTKDIQNIDSLTIEFRINNIVNVWDGNTYLLDTYSQYQSSSMLTVTSNYEWEFNNKLTDKTQDEYCSAYFNVENILWCLQFKPNNINERNKRYLFLNILVLPPNVSNIWVHCSLLLKEKNKTWSEVMLFDNDVLSIGLPNLDLIDSNLDKLDKFTFKRCSIKSNESDWFML